MIKKTKNQSIIYGVVLILTGYILFLIIPSPVLDHAISNIEIQWLLKRTENQKYQEIKLSQIREYCVDKLGVTYNYSRNHRLDEVPDEYYAKLNYVAQHLFINDDYKFIYLSVPKVACSNWKRLLLRLKNVTNENKLAWPHSNGDHKRLVDLPREEWRAVLQDYGYYKFAFVRNPWTRLVSAYVDRFTRHDKWWYGFIQQTEGKRMIKNHRVGATENEINEGSDVKFKEFVEDILDHHNKCPNEKVAVNLNEHWNPQFFIAGLCHPWIEYDFIGRYEELDTASLEVFKKVHMPDFIDKFPKPSRNSSTVLRAAVEYSLLDTELLVNLSKQFRPDFEMLGYEAPMELSHILPSIGFEFDEESV
ncbi:hypothetical protein ACHWQZ_G002424 [Mnemiopsis leidyi]